MNTKIGIVLDSTTYIPEELKDDMIYEVVPLHVTVDGNNRPEVEIKDEEIVARLENCKDLKSSSPSVGEFELAYNNLFARGVENILVIPLSKESSTTYNVARMAIDLLDEDKKSHVAVINTLINNYGVTNVLYALVKYLKKDVSFESLIEKAETLFKNSHLSFTMFDLKHLFKGGRLSRISCAIGLLFKIKPVIEMIDGKLVLTKKERTVTNIIKYYLEQIENFAKKFKKVLCRFIYLGDNRHLVDTMIEAVEANYKNVEYTVCDHVGPVFLVHLGNSGFGITLTGVDD